MKDYTSIHTYADACSALGESVDETALAKAGAPQRIIARMKCELVAKAINRGERIIFDGTPLFAPHFEEDSSLTWICDTAEDMHYKEVFVIPMRKSDRVRTFLWFDRVAILTDECVDFSALHEIYFETEEKAYHFGKYFMPLWAQAHLPDWEIGSRVSRIEVKPKEKNPTKEPNKPKSFVWLFRVIILTLITCLGMRLLERLGYQITNVWD